LIYLTIIRKRCVIRYVFWNQPLLILQAYANPKLKKIRSSDYKSFNTFGLLFIYITGFSISTLSLITEPISKWLYKRFNFQTYTYLEWMSNANLQLLRQAHESEINLKDSWSQCIDNVPITEIGVLLRPLDISELEHPRLQKAFQEMVPVTIHSPCCKIKPHNSETTTTYHSNAVT
jgi:hypothetical protein